MILCTGNPNDVTIASAIKKFLPNTEFASRTTGYDLRFWDEGSEAHFRSQIIKYNVFINSSFICNGGQMQLLEATYQEWTNHNIAGHIINIGSAAEWLGVNSEYGLYSIEKRALYERSLQLNLRGSIKVSHITAGGLNDGKPGHEDWLGLDHVANAITWILTHPVRIPHLAISV